MKLSVLIKTYNEAAKIARCLESVLVAVAAWGEAAEVIVADSRSTDATVDIARRFPVTVVMLADQEPRGCGVGVQLGYQHAQGEFVLLLDGDMQLQSGFLEKAMASLQADPRLAGVAGILTDTEANNWFDRQRNTKKPSAKPGPQAWLGGGGLYRRSAITQAGGYAANANLLGFEEADLGLRLRAHGWRLLRLDIDYVHHTGHAMNTLAVIRRMWVSGRLSAGGVLLKSALGKPWFMQVLKMFLHPIAVFAFWIALAAAALLTWPLGVSALLACAIGVLVLLAVRKRSLTDAMFSLALWHLVAVGILRGLTLPLRLPTSVIQSSVINPATLTSDIHVRTLA